MSNTGRRSHDWIMQPVRPRNAAGLVGSSGKVRVAVWSPFERLTSELRRLIDSSGEATGLELSRDCRLAQAIPESGADLAVLDVDASPVGACNLIAEIRRSAPHLSILALSARCDPRLAASALHAGAKGYVLKDRAFEELLDAIRAVIAAKSYVSPAIDRESL